MTNESQISNKRTNQVAWAVLPVASLVVVGACRPCRPFPSTDGRRWEEAAAEEHHERTYSSRASNRTNENLKK